MIAAVSLGSMSHHSQTTFSAAFYQVSGLSQCRLLSPSGQYDVSGMPFSWTNFMAFSDHPPRTLKPVTMLPTALPLRCLYGDPADALASVAADVGLNAQHHGSRP